jgi:hypothetical protein
MKIRHWEERCVWRMRRGSAVLADRDFPGCEEGSGEERIGAERNAGGAEPVHKGHQGSEGKRPEATQAWEKEKKVGGWDKKRVFEDDRRRE